MVKAMRLLISASRDKVSVIVEPTIMDKSVDTFEQNKRFLSASLRKFK